ncbi:MAG: hypothetical protein FJ096_17735, partial [Deltaproteobacteria bacterium]|nr:hypothetical protein [Deltaproteobacteria bacterium]
MYLSGAGGLSRDAVEGERLLRRACDGDEPNACRDLARKSLTGNAPDEAEALLVRACDTEPGDACVQLGELLTHREP